MFDEDFDEYCIAAGLVEVCCGAGTLRGCRRPGAENWARVSLTLSLTLSLASRSPFPPTTTLFFTLLLLLVVFITALMN